MKTITMEQATSTMKKEFESQGLENWTIIQLGENGFQYERETEYMKCTGVCMYHYDTIGRIYDCTISEFVIERYK